MYGVPCGGFLCYFLPPKSNECKRQLTDILLSSDVFHHGLIFLGPRLREDDSDI